MNGSHEEHIAGKGQNFASHYNLVHKFIPMSQAMKIPDAKAAVDKEGKKLETIPAWDLRKVKSKNQVIKQAQKNKNKVHFASLMDSSHLMNSELEPQLQKYKGRVVLRGDIVKDDSGAHAVPTEHGSSASQMTAAKVMDVIARLPDCDGQAADAISAYTQVNMGNAQKLLKMAQSHWNTSKILLFLLKETYTDTHSQGSCGKDSSKKASKELGWEKVPN